MGFIDRYLLPRQIDFNAALLSQAQICSSMVASLHQACSTNDPLQLDSLGVRAQQARTLKEQNMKLLLDVFITPYDKESIYRMITQLDWVTLSVKHFQLETTVYQLHSLQEYEPILAVLCDMANHLLTGIAGLKERKLEPIADHANTVHDRYDSLVEMCATATGTLLAQDDIKHMFRHREMLLQLKEIAKRIHVAANTLEDMAIKVI